MLQQTQVSRVVSKYEAFLARFRSAPACAAAPVAETVRLWAGLGYNRPCAQPPSGGLRRGGATRRPPLGLTG
jgi:adenine-specific DNA glycosylase